MKLKKYRNKFLLKRKINDRSFHISSWFQWEAVIALATCIAVFVSCAALLVSIKQTKMMLDQIKLSRESIQYTQRAIEWQFKPYLLANSDNLYWDRKKSGLIKAYTLVNFKNVGSTPAFNISMNIDLEMIAVETQTPETSYDTNRDWSNLLKKDTFYGSDVIGPQEEKFYSFTVDLTKNDIKLLNKLENNFLLLSGAYKYSDEFNNIHSGVVCWEIWGFDESLRDVRDCGSGLIIKDSPSSN
jgi:hypothetical protein